MQNRGNPSQLLPSKVRQISGAQTFFTTRKLKTRLPSIKTSFARELRLKVVYKLTCSGCNSTYVGQTVRHLATRVDEHRNGGSPVGPHLLECIFTEKSLRFFIQVCLAEEGSLPASPLLYNPHFYWSSAVQSVRHWWS